jgi:hypothetical protein
MKTKRKAKKAVRVSVKNKKSAWSKAAKFFEDMLTGWDDKPARPEAPKAKSRKKVSFKLNAKTKRRRKGVALKLKSA